MISPNYVGVLGTPQASAGTLFNTYTTAKSVINPTALVTLAPNFFSVIPQCLNIKVSGGVSSLTVTPGTITFQVMLGPAGSIVVFTTGAIQLNATAHTTIPFMLDIDLTLQVVGSGTTAKFMGMGWLAGVMFTLTAAQVDAVNDPGMFMVPATLPAQGGGFDSTIANILDFWVGFSISNAANGVQIAQYRATSVY